MNSKKNVSIIILCMVLVAVVSIAGTVAFLTDRESVTNTFTVGKVHITLDEAHVNKYGETIDTSRVTGNEYRLVPGNTYTKDPTVTVMADSEDSYVRMIVTITDIADLKALLGDSFLPEDYVTGWERDVWECVNIIEGTDNTVKYEFRYRGPKATNGIVPLSATDTELEPLFTQFTFPGEWHDEADLNKIAELQINVEAHAMQALGFGNEAAAWAAFEEQLAVKASQQN